MNLPLLSFALVALLSARTVVAQPSDPTLPLRSTQLRPAPPAPAVPRSTASWTALTSMTTARAQHGAVAHPDGNIYVFGGYNGSTTFSSTEAYNIATNTWTSRASMPVAMQGPATALGNDGKIYSFAGRDQSTYRSECYRYDPVTNAWSTIATMPAPRWQARALTAASGLIYVFGGWNFDLGVTPGAEVQIYNPVTNTWSMGASMPVPIMGMAAALDGTGLMHLYGGIGANPYPALVSHYVYNPVTNSWATGPSMPTPARGYTSGAAGSDGNLYITGGDSDIGMNIGTFYNNVNYYNPSTSTWSAETALPLALTEMATVAAGTNIYVTGGLSGSSAPVATIYRMSTVATPVTTTTWTGNVSADWFTAGNWSDGVPTAMLDATIPGGRPNMPAVASGTASAKVLTINSGATLNLTGGTLDVKGNLSNSGTLTASAGLLSLTGAAAQTLGGPGSSTLYNLTVGSAGAALSGAVQVQRMLTLNGNLASGGNLTLASTSALSSMVVESGGQLQGTLAVQRQVSGTMAGYRHFSAPVVGATLTQLGSGGSPITTNTSYNSSPTPGSVIPFPTVFDYDQNRLSTASPTTSSFDFGWLSPSSSAQTMTMGRGLTVQLNGSQVVTMSGTAATAPVTVTSLGNSGTAKSGWHLLGNPFLAALNLSTLRPALQAGGLADALYVFRPSGAYTGAYDQYVNGIGTGSLTDGQLAVGQGFFVRNLTAASSASLSFTNGMRMTTYVNPGFLRQASTDPRPRLDLNLSSGSAEDVVVFYAEASATTGADARFDAWKVPTATPLSLATVAGAEVLSIQGLPEISAAQVLPLTVAAAQPGCFTFEARQLLNFPVTASVVLEDRVTGTLHNLRAGAYVVPLSAGRHDGRFFLRLSDSRVTAVANARLSAALQLYPNPAAGKAFLSLPAESAARIVVLNALGQQVLTQTAKASNGLITAELNTTGLSGGVYSVLVTTPAGTATSRLVVE
ncbi:T9SS type A sorting domain-containing protein [Hymenobacter sp. BT175]|uniref:kelch repeat-containing protein n=1 Tax=Hymenobacter translucens TaxID=2886507 RepID=UPI001D0DDD2B|nr:kelch repeat-containing protein [Hymenobacter translucens]MCC2547637.1 T9SS type A sorting domain-containing protein [Hymenobacter translucens]